jgi:ABC-2 type transport system permease protein
MMSARSALTRRALVDSRARTVSFALLFAGASAAQVIGYRTTYPTRADRVAFAHGFGNNAAVRLFYGVPHDLLTVGGYAGWRVGGFMSIFASVWGVLGAVRALRTEEESGRQELILAAPISRERVLAAALGAIGIGALVLWLSALGGLVATRLPLGGSAFLALAVVSPVPLFVGVGALASQIAPSRRLATALSLSVLGIAFVLRVIADTATGLGWLRWATPLGWVEELRPFAGPNPLPLLLPLASGVLLVGLAVSIAIRRDLGSGLLVPRERSEPRLGLLSSPAAQAFRSELGLLVAWIVGVGAFALIMGIISDSFSSGLSAKLRHGLGKLAGTTAITPTSMLGIYFLFFVLVISLFASSQIVAARHEESEQRLETMLALPISRRRWLAGRLVLAAGGACALALTAGTLAWIGAASQGADVSLPRMLEAGVNCLPASLLFLGAAALGFAAVPRATPVIGYGLVVAAFLWQLLGALVDAPAWTLDLSPFHHVALVPTDAFRPIAATAMLLTAVVAALGAIAVFERRDLTGA